MTESAEPKIKLETRHRGPTTPSLSSEHESEDMKTNKKMNDAQRKAAWAEVTDPVEALEELHAHPEFLTGDHYYADLDAALWEMIDRVLLKAKSGDVDPAG